MSKLNQNRVVFFLAGTFLGSWLLGAVMGVVGAIKRT